MEVQMTAQAPNSTGRSSTPSHSHHGGGAKPVPGYLRPSAGSCHHVCKYGGTHTFEDHKEAHRPQPRPPRKQPAPESHHNHSRVLVKVRSVFRRRVGDSAATEKPSKAAAGKSKASKGGESVEWKDIVAYDTSPLPPHGSSPHLGKTSAQVTSSGDAKKKDVMKGKKSYGKAKIHEQVEGVETHSEPLGTNAITNSDKSVKPAKGKKPAAALSVENMGIDQETLHGYQILSPSLTQSRANLLRDLEREMVVQEPANVKQESTTVTYSLDPEEYAAAAESSRPIRAHRRVLYQILSPSLTQSRANLLRDLEREMVVQEPANVKQESTTVTYSLDPEEYAAAAESSRPIRAHRRVQSMSISSRSTRQPIARQTSKNSGAFKLRSRSTRAPAPEEKPARLKSRRGEDPLATTGRGIHLRIKSLRRRSIGGSGGTGTGGFVVPAVALRHQKTLEKKSQRLYNNLIEETATRLVKTRKSRVKALVGAFESVISKIAK